MMSATRLRLGEPRAARPGDELLLQQICTHTRQLLRHKQNSSNPWNFADTFVDVFPTQDTYQINVPDFGNPLAVTTSDPGNPNHIVRIIPFTSPANLNYSWPYPVNAGAYWTPLDGSNCSAMRCSFYWKGNSVFIQFLPVPYAGPAQYKIRYLQSAAGVNNMALTEEPIKSEDSDLIEIRAAKSLLANTEWQSPDSPNGQAYNSNKRRELLVSLRDDEAIAFKQFQAAQLITTGPRIHQRWDATTI